MNKYKVIGLMSGTSLDGLDIAFCELTETDNQWTYRIARADTLSYSKLWKERLVALERASSFELACAHIDYGHFLGKVVASFVKKNKIKVDLVASHGHTIFHQPEKGITFQLGSGAAIAIECGLPVVCDFRSGDVALRGQGAPLVPIGDRLLFGEYDYCLNLGGFANISFELKEERRAFDVCPVNIVFNGLMKTIGKEFDKSGRLAKSGKVNINLLAKLNHLSFYKNKGPKSLGKEWVTKQFLPLVNRSNISLQDKLCTIAEHIAIQIGHAADSKVKKKILISGGGSYNSYLVQRIVAHTHHQIILPDQKTIEFKEALIFALLGVLRIRNQINCLASVTGANADSIGGSLYTTK